MTLADVLVVGEALLDVVEGCSGDVASHPGGSAANAAVALGRLGADVGLATCLGEDSAGRTIAAHLAGAGVRLVGDPWVLVRTATATARTRVDGSADYAFDLDWRPAPVDPAGARAVHVGSLGAVLAPGADVVREVVRGAAGRALVSYDVNARTSLTGSGPEVVERVERLAGLADVVKVSDEDVADLWPDRSQEAALDRLLGLGAGAVVLTRGSAGALWRDREGVLEVAAVPVEVADTIGAGDTFAAVLLDGLLALGRPWPREGLREALERAATAAAITVSRPGADPPTADELRRAVASRDDDRGTP
ncbi:MAG: PfkB family carbohydrate kinase [Nocardioides sp.]|nr:PfkB family carbohydrate kinase [Nocardioides sp.]